MTARAARRFWLMKSEPDECSIDDALAAPDRTVPWVGVRNYQARNFMRDAMRPGDGVLFWHSGCEPPGIAGLAEVASAPYPDPTQFDPTSKYFDPKSTPDRPQWDWVTVAPVKRLRFVPLDELREMPELADCRLLARGNRLSVMPLTQAEFDAIVARGTRAR